MDGFLDREIEIACFPVFSLIGGMHLLIRRKIPVEKLNSFVQEIYCTPCGCFIVGTETVAVKTVVMVCLLAKVVVEAINRTICNIFMTRGTYLIYVNCLNSLLEISMFT